MGLSLHFTVDARDFLADNGFDHNYGARPLRRALQNYVADPLAEEILKGRFPNGSAILVEMNEEKSGFIFDIYIAPPADSSLPSDPEEEHSIVNGDDAAPL